MKRLVSALTVLIIATPAAIGASYGDQIAAYSAISKGDYKAALPILKRMAAEGDSQAQVTLGTMYFNGVPGAVAQDKTTGLELLDRAARKMNGEALAILGNAYLQGNGVPRDYNKAFDYLNKAVGNGVSHGKIGLAVCYLKGWGTEQNLSKSFQLTKEAAFQKVPGAAYNLAYYYRKGIAVEPDEKEANTWYTKAAPGLYSEAARRPEAWEYPIALGMMLQNGWGVAKDPKQAAKYFSAGIPKLKQQMSAGKPNAYMLMAEMMENGWGVPKDVTGATNLYKKAASLGDKEAEMILDRMQSMN